MAAKRPRVGEIDEKTNERVIYVGQQDNETSEHHSTKQMILVAVALCPFILFLLVPCIILLCCALSSPPGKKERVEWSFYVTEKSMCFSEPENGSYTVSLRDIAFITKEKYARAGECGGCIDLSSDMMVVNVKDTATPVPTDRNTWRLDIHYIMDIDKCMEVLYSQMAKQ